MNEEKFVQEVANRAVLPLEGQADGAIQLTLEVLGTHLPDPHAKEVARRLPERIAQFLRRERFENDVEPDEFYREIAQRAGVPIGFAREHAQVVCQVLAEAVGVEGRQHLRVHLPRAMADLFTPRGASSPPPSHIHPHRVEPGEGRTLASGRPGSTNPVSEAASAAHRDSIARSDDPHADTKVSSARGLSAEQHHETLAGGRPGSKHSLSEARG